MAVGDKSAAESGHLTEVHMQASAASVDLAADPFLEVGELMSIGGFTLSSNTKEVTPHGGTVATFLMGKINRMEPIDFEANYVHDGTTQDEDTGVLGHKITGNLFRTQLRGPNYDAGPPEVDFIDFAGYMSSVTIEPGKDENQRMLKFTIQPSGVFQIDDTEFGAAT